MREFVVVEICGRQYLVQPKVEFLVDKLDAAESFTCEKVLLVNDAKGLRVGGPYLERERCEFKVLGQEKQSKVRVATYSAKANTRRVKGTRAVKSRLVLK